MKIKRIILFFVLAILCGQVISAQTTEGTEFWATFMNNVDMPSGLTLKLIASSRQDATVTVANPQTGYSQNFTVQADQVAEFIVPQEQGYTFASGSAQKRGLKITSTAPISLYASNFYEFTYDATIVLPVTALGTDYVAQIFENTLMAKELAVVATQNNTTLTITPHARTTNGKVKNIPFSLTLNAGETYLLMSQDEGNDFSGTRVQTNYPVAVFSGHQCINVPTNNYACDHIVEQQMPTPMWGKQFALTKTKGQNGDRVIITARDANTDVKLNGTKIATLQAMQSYQFRLTDNSAFVETSGPAACYQYLEGGESNRNIGDPSSVHISPVEQKVKQITFATFQTSKSRTHYVNVVTTVSGAEGMMLDGKSVANEFSPLIGNNALRFAQIPIPHGTHTLKTSKDGFTGHVYGLGDWESYAYTMGSATILLDGQILVDGTPRANMEYSDIRCYKTPITFAPHATVNISTIEWDFGDGQKSTQKTVSHTYSSPGTYHVEMRIANEDGKDTARTTLTLVETLRDTVRASICDGEEYSLAGQTFTTAGKHEITLSSAGGCDSIVTLFLSVGQTYEKNETATFRQGSSYRWHNRWFREAGVYRDTLPTVNGCDSIFILTLTAIEAATEMKDTICWQEKYNFRGYDYILPPVDKYRNREYINYTLEYFDKDECEHYRMDLAIIPKESGSYELFVDLQDGEAYDFFGELLTTTGVYTKTIESACNCEQQYTLYLYVHSYKINRTEASLCNGDSYTFNDKEYTDPGKYRDTVYTDAGVTEVQELTLTDSRSHTEIDVSNVSSYDFNGTVLTTSGTYTTKLKNEAGCDSIVTLHLGINEKCKITAEENRSLCEGKTLTWNKMTCIPGNDYSVSLTSVGGCDSTVTLHLAKLEKKAETITASVCKGDYYCVGEERFSEEGTHTVHLDSSNGCDSVVTLNLTYKKAFTNTTDATIKPGEEYPWQGETFNQEGVYTKGFVSKTNGCDSIEVLRLMVKPDEPIECHLTKDSVVKICNNEAPFIIGGQSFYISTKTTVEITGIDCDTTVNLDLTVKPTYNKPITDMVAKDEPYVWGDETIDTSVPGVYTYTHYLTSADGCDSTVVLTLTVAEKTIIRRDSTRAICEGESYNWFGTLYDKTGDYEFYKNDVASKRKFSIDANGTQVVFAPANLQYQASTNTWRFAQNQWDFVGEDNKNMAETYEGWMDLFGWGTSGYNKSKPYITDNDNTLYGDGVNDIAGTNFDWGLYNTIGSDPAGTWRCMSYEEWDYLLESRTNAANLRSVASVNGIHGFVFLPDDWQQPAETSFTPNADSYTTNKYDIHQWALMEAEGAIFLPAGGWRDQAVIKQAGSEGYYWTTTVLNNKDAWEFKFGTNASFSGTNPKYKMNQYRRYSGNTVRLVRDYEEKSFVDSVYILHLKVNPVYDIPEEHTIYIGESFTWNGVDYSSYPAGDYTDMFTTTSSQNCDSTRRLTLHISDRIIKRNEFTEYICPNGEYTWENVGTFSEEKDYEHTFPIENGDSIVTLHLKYYPHYEDIIEEREICEGKSCTWEGDTYTEAGDYPKTLTTVDGCDSVVTLRLTVWPAQTTDIYDTILVGGKYTFDGNTYEASGDYKITKTTVHDCDSTVILHLATNQLNILSVESGEQCAGDEFLDIVLHYTGAAHEARITLRDQDQGLRDTTVTIGEDGGVRLHSPEKAGHYTGSLELLFRGQMGAAVNIELTILYPSTVMEQAWDDVIAVLTHDYNGGYDFTAFHWYENGEALSGETRSYLYKPLITGGEYSVLLTEKDGTQLMTCPLIAEKKIELTLYPTVAAPRQQIHCYMSQPGEITLYDAMGRQVSHSIMTSGDNVFEAPFAAGMYTVLVRQKSTDKMKSYKLIIQ